MERPRHRGRPPGGLHPPGPPLSGPGNNPSLTRAPDGNRPMAHQQDSGDLLEMADLLTPAAIRAAATLRLADRLDAPADVAKLAEITGTRADLLELLLRHLTDKGVLT